MREVQSPNIHIYIDRLILDGLPIERIQAQYVQDAIATELTRLLTENGLAESLYAGIAVPSVRANAIQIPVGSSPSQLGTQIAQSVYSGVGDIR